MKTIVRGLHRGQKGFTLIELLVVVAILGVLAAVAVPNVGKFMDKGQVEAGRAELHNVQTAIMAMMADKGITSVTSTHSDNTSSTADMTAFPNDTNPLYGAVGSRYINSAATEWLYFTASDGTVSQGSKAP